MYNSIFELLNVGIQFKKKTESLNSSKICCHLYNIFPHIEYIAGGQAL